MGENIGATARAMANFGLSDLRLINPRDGWPNLHAEKMSSGAFDHIPQPQIYKSLLDASHDCHMLLATTARRRDMVKPVLTPQEAAEKTHICMKHDERVGFVFGAERTGLENDEIALCDSIINIPTDPAFSSLNLAQAVLLVVSQISAVPDFPPEPRAKDSPLADKETVFGFLERLEDDLDKAAFFKSEGLKPTMVRNIQNIFTRAELTEQEVRTLHGILTSLTSKLRP